MDEKPNYIFSTQIYREVYEQLGDEIDDKHKRGPKNPKPNLKRTKEVINVFEQIVLEHLKANEAVQMIHFGTFVPQYKKLPPSFIQNVRYSKKSLDPNKYYFKIKFHMSKPRKK